MLIFPVCAAAEAGQKQILFINSYGYDFETVPMVIQSVSTRLKEKNAIHYLFMNEKYVDEATAEQALNAELADLTAKTRYDVVILGDDAAFDFAIQHREQYFQDIPLVYEDINSMDKAKKYIQDPLIAGVVESFPVRETIEVARKIYPQARQVVVITDNSISGRGSAEQVLQEQSDFPYLDFQVFDCSTMDSEEIQRAIAAYSEDTILIYTVFNVDKTGKRYTLPQGVKLVTDAARIPIFKADEAGVGEGLLGGYVLSYASIGQATANLVEDILQGKQISEAERCQRGNSRYLFDAAVMARYKIAKDQLPENAEYIHDTPGFFETYGHVLLPVFIIAILIINVILWYSRRQKAILLEKLKESGEVIRVEEAANRAKTEFLSRMSHDIRTPLNVIMGMNFLAREEIHRPDVALGYLDKIEASSTMLLTLINDILDVSQIESGKMELKLTHWSLAELFDNVSAVFKPLCDMAHIRFSAHCPGRDYEVIGDYVRLNQILDKLLANAAKYTAPGGAVSFAVQSRQVGQTVACEFTIADTGCGIPAEFQKMVFEPFSQAPNAEINQVHGSGIGLMIVKNLVNLMHGTIQLQSDGSTGTTITISLALELDVKSADPAAAAGQEKEDVLPLLTGKRVLVVEDNQLNAEIEKAILEKAGIIVAIAENGRIAVDAVKNAGDSTYDAILMDVRMPVMGGIEATAAIRSLHIKWCRTIPIIAVTADAFDEDVRRFLDCGMDDCLTKPIDVAKLYESLAKHIGTQ